MLKVCLGLLLTGALIVSVWIDGDAIVTAQEAKAKPLVVDPQELNSKGRAELKDKYDGKFVEFMGVSDWKVEDKDTDRPWFRLVRGYYVVPAAGDDAKKKEIARAVVRAYITMNRGQAESELNKWKNSKWKCEFTVQGTMKVGEEIAIENARLTFIHRVPRGKLP